jgi:hypothetical protein
MNEEEEERGEKNSGIQGQLHHTTAAASSLSDGKNFHLKFLKKIHGEGLCRRFYLVHCFTVDRPFKVP